MPSFARIPRLGRWPRLVSAGLCLVLAAASTTSARGASGRPERTVGVVVATRDLPAGHRIAARDVARARWPARLAPSGAVPDIRAVVGRRVAGPVTVREAIGRSRLLGGDLTAGLPTGTVAVPVTVAGVRSADLLRPGDRVEIIATARSDDGFSDPQPASGDVSVVASGLIVLSVLTGRDGNGTDLVVAADHATALRLVRVSTSRVFAALRISP